MEQMTLTTGEIDSIIWNMQILILRNHYANKNLIYFQIEVPNKRLHLKQKIILISQTDFSNSNKKAHKIKRNLRNTIGKVSSIAR